jgi:uncharacterized protein YcaQ
MPRSVEELRRMAVGQTLFAPTSLKKAMERLGFVQADPIRSPARAQDLILRHRVTNYRINDLEERYPQLDLEEAFLYAYGFMPNRVFQFVRRNEAIQLSKREREVLEVVRESGAMHPARLRERLGAKRVRNAWGGFSQDTKKALDRLHHAGHLRVVRRDNGIRVYQAAAPISDGRAPGERFADLVHLLVGIFAPSPRRSLQSMLSRIGKRRVPAGVTRQMLADLIERRELREEIVDGVSYILPKRIRAMPETERTVRILAPFDPIVWDRSRFEHLFGWPYRFEAYVPKAKRVRGYYAMPLLWGTDIIGWVNGSVDGGQLTVDCGYVGKKPREKSYSAAFDAEVERLKTFLRI